MAEKSDLDLLGPDEVVWGLYIFENQTVSVNEERVDTHTQTLSKAVMICSSTPPTITTRSVELGRQFESTLIVVNVC